MTRNEIERGGRESILINLLSKATMGFQQTKSSQKRQQKQACRRNIKILNVDIYLKKKLTELAFLRVSRK